MLKRLKILSVAAAVTFSTVATASAAPVIDFSNGPAGAGGNIRNSAGGNLIGTNIPIGFAFFFETSAPNTPFAVTGTASGTGGIGFGDLDFDTATGNITINGCVAGLGIGTAACATPQLLLSGKITGFEHVPLGGLFVTSGFDVKHAGLLAAVGLPPNTPWVLSGSFATALRGTSGTGSAAVSVDIRNTAVPEPATMVLLGTGLLAAFRARRRQS